MPKPKLKYYNSRWRVKLRALINLFRNKDDFVLVDISYPKAQQYQCMVTSSLDLNEYEINCVAAGIAPGMNINYQARMMQANIKKAKRILSGAEGS